MDFSFLKTAWMYGLAVNMFQFAEKMCLHYFFLCFFKLFYFFTKFLLKHEIDQNLFIFLFEKCYHPKEQQKLHK